MIARIQQATTFSLFAFATLWALGFAAEGAYAWGAAGAVLILFGYAIFLALEFVLLARFGAEGGAQAPRASQLMRAWAGELVWAPLVFCWRQPFRSKAFPDSLGGSSPPRRGVLLVHGFVCNRGFWNPWLKRFRAMGIPFMAVDLEPPFGSIDAYIDTIEAARARLHDATGHSPVIVAHSMGGLAVRAWQARHPARAHRIVTIASPHHGTWLGRFAVTTNGEEMHTGSAWLEALSRREGESSYVQFTCFYGHCDNIVFPVLTATLPGADNRHLSATAHIHMAFRPDVIQEVLHWVEPTPAGADPPTAGIPPSDWSHP